jgi:hypothetical protein
MNKRHRSYGSIFNDEYAARDALSRGLADGREPTGEDLRKWWKSVQDLLWAYSVAVAEGGRPEPPPAELAERLSKLAGYLAVGRIPSPIERARSKGGNPAAGPDERRAKGLAAAYYKASQQGIVHNGQLVRIADDRALKTLSEWFDVGHNTIRTWVKKECPAFLGANNVNADVIIKLTQRAAKVYKTWGRGRNALQRREGKRR